MKHLISPSLLSANFLDLRKEVEMINQSEADWLHLDIMDGVFVPNISFGFPVLKAVKEICQKPMDAHLMIIRPEKYIGRFAEAGADMLSFHLNATDTPSEALAMVKDAGMQAGLAINPDIPVESLFKYLHECDFVLIMSVFAGFGGQKFIETTYSRIETVKNEIMRSGLSCLVEVDGGISPANARSLADAGADILVAGSSVFGASDPAAAILSLRQ